MIFRRAAQREFTQNAVAVFVALFAILLTTQLIRLLGDAAGGGIAPEAVAALLGFNALNYLSILLSLTLFISVLLALSRAYRDSEMAVWLSSGVSLVTWVNPVLRFALPLVAVIATFSLFLAPWALNKSAEYRNRMDQRDDASRVSPGSFKESGNAERVFFVEAGAGADGRVKNIFISSVQHGRLGVMAAAEGFSEVHANGDRFLVLGQGRRYEGTPGTTEYRVMEFDRYAIRTESREMRGVEKSPKHMSTLDLMKDPRPDFLGELVWRIGIPLSALTLALLAIPLSFANPRGGRTNNLVFALLTYMIYSNLLSVSQAWVIQGKVSFAVGVWAVHVVMFFGLLLLFSRRLVVFSWGRLWR
ncbi:MAG: LPS export ABC transporter permease LptF [Gammaproteobacteria bacterium]|nr:LPS export ABC transporter permease LptF [Gammaproteobacteria bacterium]MBU1647086.1 LPS export ABC transporter permease LptF [Gammaproteobacteria bacterium]MBU1972598.1 LPS export ABC transporter permease LptF [Gammaproteobacteria bacterium]